MAFYRVSNGGTPLAVYGYSCAVNQLLLTGHSFSDNTDVRQYITSMDTTISLDDYLVCYPNVSYGSGSRVRFQTKIDCEVSYQYYDISAGTYGIKDHVAITAGTWMPDGQVGWIIIWS